MPTQSDITNGAQAPAQNRVTHLQAGEGEKLWVVGDTYTFKATGASTQGAAFIFEASIPPGGGPPPHIHQREDEAYYLLEGELEVLDNDRTFIARQGSFVYIPHGRLHRFKNVSQADSRMLVIFTPAGFENFFREVGLPAQAGGKAPPLGLEEIARTIAAAPKYGLELPNTEPEPA